MIDVNSYSVDTMTKFFRRRNNDPYDQNLGDQEPRKLSRRSLLKRLGLSSLALFSAYNLERDQRPTGDKFPSVEKLSASAFAQLVERMFRYDRHDGQYIESIASPNDIASAWSHGQMIDMLQLAASGDIMPRAAQMLESAENVLPNYYSDTPRTYPAGYNSEVSDELKGIEIRFVDDNLWFAEYFMQRYKQTGDRQYLDKANDIAELFIRSWNDSGGNGAFWQAQLKQFGVDVENRDRAIVSNAPAIPLLIELAKHYPEKSADYIDISKKVYDWLQELRDPESDTETGLYFDKFQDNGEIDRTFYPYCQAKMIDATIALHSVDPDKYPLEEARQLFDKSIKLFTSNGRLGHDASFDAMLVKSGMRLATILHDPDFTENVHQFAKQADKAARHRPQRLAKLYNAAGAVKLAILAEMETSDWDSLWYTTKPLQQHNDYTPIGQNRIE